MLIFYYKRTGVYNCVIDNKIVLFTYQTDNWKVTIDSEDAEFKSITSKEINFSDSKGVNYHLQAEKNMVNTTTVFYYYGTVSSVSPTPAYYYPLAIVSPEFPKEDLISFEELSNPYLITSTDLRHSVLLPPHSEEFTYLDLVEDAGVTHFGAISLTQIPGDPDSIKGNKARGVYWTKPDKSGKEVVRDESLDESQYSEFIKDYENTYFQRSI